MDDQSASAEVPRAPAVAVVIAAYNEEMSLERCLDSVLQCTPPDAGFEVIVVDDGSSDRTAEIGRAIAQHDPRVRILSQANRGKGAAQNAGVRASTAPRILVTDADSMVPQDWIFKMSRNLDEADLVQGGCYPSSMDSALLRIQHAYCAARFGIRNRWTTPSVGANNGFRRRAWEQVGGFSEATKSPTADFRDRVG